MHDAHFHLSDALYETLRTTRTPGIANAASAEEFDRLSRLSRGAAFTVSAGIHPWYADRVTFDEFLPTLERAAVIGEIGLDRIWCETDVTIQRERFLRQLEYAAEKGKPVVCHTKAAEAECAELIARFPNTYLIHWYSCLDHLETFIGLGCYFSIGPSVGIDPAVTRTAERVPLDRILFESDGIDAIAWAFNTDASSVDYTATMRRTLQVTAELRGIGTEELEQQADGNLRRFLCGKGA